MLVKVCGITNLEDARKALDLGAGALGFNFYRPSPRFISLERAVFIIRQLPPTFLSVGIFVGVPSAPEMSAVDILQIHGLQDESQLLGIDRRIFVATSPSQAHRFPNYEILIDVSWGTGQRADWDELLNFRREYILSGGLTPGNVGEAIRKLRPAGVDVCSGVESSPGQKDTMLLDRFMAAVKAASLAPW